MNGAAIISAAIVFAASILSGCVGIAPAQSLTDKPATTAAVASIAVSPNPAATTAGGKIQFAATVQGTATNKSVTWKVSSGSISSAGLYTAALTIRSRIR